MNDAIERAAKAVSAVRAKRIGHHTGAEDVWERRQPHVKQAIRVEVRAALEAIREHTPEMIRAGGAQLPDAILPHGAASEVFRAMIDEALK